MESDKKSTDTKKVEKQRMAEELAQQNVDNNLSRPTHHDSNLTTGINPAFDTALNQATTTNLGLPGTYSSPNLTGGSIPITQENEFVSRNLGGIGAPLTGSQFVSGSQFTSTIPQSNLATEIPITTGTGEVIEEEPHKKGFFSKIKGIFHHKKSTDTDIRTEEPVIVEEKHHKEKHHKVKDPYTEALKNEPGYLDEKGTTLSMPQGTQSNAQLGLPVLGPDYTHGTHGTTTHTVFTGGQTGIGLESNLATTSLPVPVEGLQTGLHPGLEFQPGIETGIHKRGIDLSGANATHIDRDITLQEGGLLGLRQGAVTGNPGDIITNYVERGDLDLPETTTKYVQPMVTQTFVQPVTTMTTSTVSNATFQQTMPEQLINVTDQHLGETGTGLGVGTCSLVKGSQNPNLNQKF